jgi:hypothetical protein
MRFYDSALIQAAREADVIDEVTDDLTYLGFFFNGDQTRSLIKKIEKVGTVTTFQYPEGRVEAVFNWADRAELNYLFKK